MTNRASFNVRIQKIPNIRIVLQSRLLSSQRQACMKDMRVVHFILIPSNWWTSAKIHLTQGHKGLCCRMPVAGSWWRSRSDGEVIAMAFKTDQVRNGPVLKRKIYSHKINIFTYVMFHLSTYPRYEIAVGVVMSIEAHRNHIALSSTDLFLRNNVSLFYQYNLHPNIWGNCYDSTGGRTRNKCPNCEHG